MAKATPRTVEKTRQVLEKYTEEDGLVLEITAEEASFLAALLGSHVAGGGTLRVISSGIWDTLITHGFGKSENDTTRKFQRGLSGMVYTPKEL